MSSLALQLASLASLDSTRLGASKASSTQPSYLFTPTEAAQHDLETIHSLGLNGFEELKELDSSLLEFEDDLFGEGSKQTDRMIISKQENEDLGEVLDRFLRRLGKHVPTRACAKVVEWLVRRFRVHEMNVEGVLACFFPYHDSPQFVRILSILRIPKNSHLTSLLVAPQTAHLPLTRHHLIASLTKDKSNNLLRFITSLLPKAIEEGCVHRTLVNFHAATLVGFLEHGGANRKVGDGELTAMVPGVVESLKGDADCVSANYIILLALSRKATLTPQATHALVLSILNAASPSGSTSDKVATQLASTVLGLLQSQDEVAEVGKDISDILAKIPNFGKLMAESAETYELSKALRPILKSLISNLNANVTSTTLLAFITSPSAPPAATIVPFLIRSLLEAVQNSPKATEARLKVLAVLKERHSSIWEEETRVALDKFEDEEDEKKTEFLQLCDEVSASSNKGGNGVDGDVFLSVNSADSTSRLAGVKSLLEKLVKGDEAKEDEMDVDSDDDEEFRASASSNLLSRLSDPYLPIIQAIYSSPSLLFTAIPSAALLLNTIVSAINTPLAHKSIVRRHLQFLAGPFATRYPELAVDVVQQAFFGSLLVTKPRQVMARGAWEVLAGKLEGGEDGVLVRGGMFEGLAEEVVAALEEEKDGKHEKQAAINVLIASKIGANIMESSSFSTHVNFLLAQLSASDAHPRILAHLVLTVVLRSLSGQRAVEIGIKIVERLRAIPGALEGLDVTPAGQAEQVVLKPNSFKTTQRVRGTLLLTLQTIKTSSPIVWLDAASQTPSSKQIVHLSYLIYGVVNSSLAPPALSTPLLRSLFTNLRDDALLFLASIWTAPLDHSEQFSPELRTAALKHAEAFLRAHVKEDGKETVDFQTIVPALVVALGFETKSVREAALGCLKLVEEVLGEQSGVPYALEGIYGVDSKFIQVLKPADLRRYIETLLKDSAALVIDPEHVVSLHQNYITTVKGEKRMDANFKRSVLCFLLSHVSAWSLPSARIALLRTSQPMRAASRVEILQPVLERLFQHQPATVNDETKVLWELLFDSYDRSALPVLNETPAIWVTFKEALGADASTDFGRLVRRAALGQLQSVLYQALPGSEQVEVVEILIRQITNEETAETGDIKTTLRSLNITSEIMVAVLAKLRSTAEVVRGPKKSKQDSELHSKALQAFHRGLVVVIEARSLESLEGDATLLAALLDILASLLDSRTKSDLNVDYPEQLLLTALCSIAAKVESIPVAEQIDVNTVIKVISDCRNPQTFQQGLLLISTLARLVPALVLQNVLPIFISVGANAVQRDDAYTFRVVEKTIESIIPVMISQRREETTDRLQLWNQSRELLLVFTGMAPHLPAHRKTRLFSHLVEALGPSDFLGPVCMLLLEKAGSKLKQKSTDPLAAFSLPLSLIESFAGRVRFEALNDVASEAGRLLQKLGGDEMLESFLGGLSTMDVADTSKIDRRRISTLLTFLHLAASSKSSVEAVAGTNAADAEVQSLVGQLLNLRSVASTQQALEGTEEILVACQTALDSSTRLLSVAAFADALEPLLQGEDIKMQLAAFGLLANRLPGVKVEARQTIASTMVVALNTALPIIASNGSEVEVLHVIQAVEVIASSATTSEDAVLTQVVEAVISKGKKSMQSQRLLASIFSLLSVLNRRLGPRLIPFVKPFVAFSVEILNQGCKDIQKNVGSFRENLLPYVLSAVGSLVASVPTFLGAQLVEVLSAVLQPALLAPSAVPSKTTSPVQSLLNVVAKTVPSKSAFPSVFELWAKVQKDSAASIGAFFDLLRRVLRNAGRDALNAQLKATFAFFLTAFDLRWTLRSSLSAEEIYLVETKVVSAFMEIVVKLSEGTFRPLFVRVYDWAAVALVEENKAIDDAHLVARRTTLFFVMEGLLEKFKNIMTPYTDIVLDHAIELLQAFASEKLADAGLWTQIMIVFQKSFDYDQAAFWTDEHLSKLLPTVVAQLPLVPNFPTEATLVYSTTLASLASATSSPSILKTLNHSILLHTRSASPQIRSLALEVTAAVWAKAGDDMLELVPQAVSDFIAECVEDEDESVEKSARAVLVVLEALVGPLGAFLGDE